MLHFNKQRLNIVFFHTNAGIYSKLIKIFRKMLIYSIILSSILVLSSATSPEEEQGVRYANRCETCKILATELQERLKETGKSHDVLELG